MYILYRTSADEVQLLCIPEGTSWSLGRDDFTENPMINGLTLVVGERRICVRDAEFWIGELAERAGVVPAMLETERLLNDMVKAVALAASHGDMIDLIQIEKILIEGEYFAQWVDKGWMQPGTLDWYILPDKAMKREKRQL